LLYNNTKHGGRRGSNTYEQQVATKGSVRTC
jgi:hypothetical protein